MLSTIQHPHRSFRIRALAIIGAALVIAIVSQLAVRLAPAAPIAKPAAVDPLQPTIGDLDPGTTALGSDGATTGTGSGLAADADLTRIRADIAFWGARVDKNADDFISSNQLGIAEIGLARSTGDLSAYLSAEAAFEVTLKRDPTNPAALGYKGSVLVSLHRFDEAATLALSILAKHPNDPVALATLGDAKLELGDLAAAREAYRHADAVAASAATQGRLGHLAFITGDAADALAATTTATSSSVTEGAEGERAAFYQYQLADVLISTGDRAGAAKAYAVALASNPRSFLALAGLARVAAAAGDLDEAITRLTDAIAIVPQPDFLARRGDLYTLRGADGDPKRAAADYAEIEVIAKLAGAAGNVYDRTLALYLANHGLEPERAVTLTEGELATRKDVYGYDAYAWALLADGRPADADAAMTKALAVGTKDAKVLYHAGMIAAALGHDEQAKALLQQSLDLDPSFDPLQVARARAELAKL